MQVSFQFCSSIFTKPALSEPNPFSPPSTLTSVTIFYKGFGGRGVRGQELAVHRLQPHLADTLPHRPSFIYLAFTFPPSLSKLVPAPLLFYRYHQRFPVPPASEVPTNLRLHLSPHPELELRWSCTELQNAFPDLHNFFFKGKEVGVGWEGTWGGWRVTSLYPPSLVNVIFSCRTTCRFSFSPHL